MRLSSFRVLFGIDLRTQALFRACLALLIIADLTGRLFHWQMLYGEHGIFPRDLAITHLSEWRFSLYFLSDKSVYHYILLAINFLSAFALLIGYRTKLAIFLCWLLMVSLDNWNRIMLQDGDQLIVCLLFWAFFLPVNTRFSIDAALSTTPVPRDNNYFSIATMALLLQCIYVYVFGALLKTGSEWIPEATAVYYALQMDSLATDFGLILREFSALLPLLTFFVWWIELLAPLFMFSPIFHTPARLVTQFLLICMHIGFLLFLKIGLFGYISITTLLCFTPGRVWDWLGGKLKKPDSEKIKIFYDQDCEFCRKVCYVFRTFFLPPTIPIEPAQQHPDIRPVLEEHNSWVVTDATGAIYLKWRAVNFVVKQSPLFRPLGNFMDLPLFRRPQDWLYNLIGNNRSFLGSLTQRALPWRPLDIRPSIATTAFVTIMMIGVFYINLAQLPQVDLRIPGWLRDFSRGIQLSQKWDMFAPRPAKRDGWYVVRGYTKSSTVVDPYLMKMLPPSFDKPESVSDYYGYYRLRKYLFRLSNNRYKKYRNAYADYLCNRWNREHTGEDSLEKVRLYFVEERTSPDNQPPALRTRRLLTRTCR